MATVLRNRFSYHRRLFLLLFAFSWALVACFVTFQYSREKRFKAERLDARLQLFNLRLLDALGEGTAPGAFLTGHPLPYGDLRVTVIDDDGRVLFDNSADSLPAANHLGRPEVTEAIAHGTGYTIHRHSESTDQYYFYSAMKGDGIIVRSAVPYSVSLREVLAADWEFLWFMLGVTLLMSIAAYFTTRRLGHNITRLNEFAEHAERGERPFKHWKMALCSLSTGRRRTWCSLARGTIRWPAVTSVSLLARAMSFPDRMAAMVGRIPIIPTTAVTRISYPSMAAISIRPSIPETILVSVSPTRRARSFAFSSSQTPQISGLNSRISCSLLAIMARAGVCTRPQESWALYLQVSALVPFIPTSQSASALATAALYRLSYSCPFFRFPNPSLIALSVTEEIHSLRIGL